MPILEQSEDNYKTKELIIGKKKLSTKNSNTPSSINVENGLVKPKAVGVVSNSSSPVVAPFMNLRSSTRMSGMSNSSYQELPGIVNTTSISIDSRNEGFA